MPTSITMLCTTDKNASIELLVSEKLGAIVAQI
jgi:hypothetical protein